MLDIRIILEHNLQKILVNVQLLDIYTSSIPYLVIDILDITDMHVLDISEMCDGGK